MLSSSSSIENQNTPRYGVVILLVLLIAMPKLSIIKLPLPDNYPGIRLEDLLLFFLFLIYLISITKRGTFSVNEFPGGRASIVLLLYAFLSGLLLKALYNTPDFLVLIRWIEYFFIYTAVFYLLKVRWRELEIFFIIFILMNFFTGTLQYFDIIGGFRSYEYVESSTRPFGITGGIWEISVTLNIVVFVLLLKFISENRLKAALFLLTFSLIFMIVIGARTPFVVFMLSMIWLFHSKKLLPFYVIFSIALPIFFLVLFYTEIGERISVVFNINNVEYFLDMIKWSMQRDEISYEEFEALFSEDISISWAARLGKWSVALSNYFYSPLTILLGTGIGSAGLYIDGMWTRLTAELGVVGLIFYFRWLSSLVKKSKYSLMLISIVLISGFTLDTFNSSKIMGCFFLSIIYVQLKFPRFQKQKRT